MNNKLLLGIGLVCLGFLSFFIVKKMTQPKSRVAASTLVKAQNTNSALIVTQPIVNIKTVDVNYFEDNQGFFATPAKAGNYPGVVMIHEWWGLNDNIKDMARKLAAEGYLVFAVDLYDGKVAKDAKEAQLFVSKVNQTKALENMRAAMDYLRQQGATKMASLGWCFGGGESLQLALSGQKMNATILYYGTPLVSDQTMITSIKWPVLGIFGDKDQTIPLDSIKKFESALTDLGIQKEIYIYPGLGHAFANPSGQSYAPDETKDAWGKTLAFLSKNLK